MIQPKFEIGDKAYAVENGHIVPSVELVRICTRVYNDFPFGEWWEYGCKMLTSDYIDGVGQSAVFSQEIVFATYEEARAYADKIEQESRQKKPKRRK